MKKDMRKQIRHLSEAHEKIQDDYLDDSKFAFGHNTLPWVLAEKKSAIKVYLILLGSSSSSSSYYYYYYYYYYMPTGCPPGKEKKRVLKKSDHKHMSDSLLQYTPKKILIHCYNTHTKILIHCYNTHTKILIHCYNTHTKF